MDVRCKLDTHKKTVVESESEENMERNEMVGINRFHCHQTLMDWDWKNTNHDTLMKNAN